MTDKKRAKTEEIENTLACSAFAEEGVPCPIGGGEKEGVADQAASSTDKKKTLEAVENDFACTAFHEQNEECPIDRDRKK